MPECKHYTMSYVSKYIQNQYLTFSKEMPREYFRVSNQLDGVAITW